LNNAVKQPGRAARIDLWLLPAYGFLLGLSTLTHQPPVADFDAYARYVTTDVFLVSHLGASILGAALAVLGVVAVTAYLVAGRAAGLAVAGLVLTTVANIYLSAAFGSATFVQPGIGRAHLAGVEGMPALNADTAYGAALTATAAGATLLLIASAIVVGIAIARTHHRPQRFWLFSCRGRLSWPLPSRRESLNSPSGAYRHTTETMEVMRGV
jgi:hypothetical protein